MNDIQPVMLGGLGEKVSNGGTQYYNQDRVYDSRSVSITISTVFTSLVFGGRRWKRRVKVKK